TCGSMAGVSQNTLILRNPGLRANRKPLVRMKGAISAPRLPGDPAPYRMLGRLRGWRTAAERVGNASQAWLNIDLAADSNSRNRRGAMGARRAFHGIPRHPVM